MSKSPILLGSYEATPFQFVGAVEHHINRSDWPLEWSGFVANEVLVEFCYQAAEEPELTGARIELSRPDYTEGFNLNWAVTKYEKRATLEAEQQIEYVTDPPILGIVATRASLVVSDEHGPLGELTRIATRTLYDWLRTAQKNSSSPRNIADIPDRSQLHGRPAFLRNPLQLVPHYLLRR